MNLFISDINKSFEILSKAGNPGGGPRTGNPGGGPRTGAPRNITSLPGPKTGNPGGGPRTGAKAGMKMPSTPGAASGGGKQIVDCPLGAECPDGGRHEMGGARYREHLAQSMKQKQSGTKPLDESKGQPTEKPGVMPGSQNIGSLGSDQVKKPEKTVEMDMSSQATASAKDKTQVMKLDPQEKKLRRNESRAKATKETPTMGVEATQEMPAAARVPPKDLRGAEFASAMRAAENAKNEKIAAEHKRGVDHNNQINAGRQARIAQRRAKRAGADVELPDTANTLLNMPAVANVDATGENPAENRKTIRMQAVTGDPNRKRQPVPNPLDPNTAPLSSKPTDHYKLAQVARASGDEEGAKAQEELARKRAANLSSEEHKQLADQLRKEGMNDQADYHESIYNRVNSYKDETAETAEDVKATKEVESKIKDVHKEQSSQASQDLEDAKKKHEETKAKAKELADKAKTSGKKPPANKKAEKKLKKPSTDGEKLKHENHTSRAKRTADIIESHLKNNKTLSGTDRARLERAHKMAVYHSKIEYTPTAAHRSELGEVERTIKDLGVKEHFEEAKAKEDAQVTAAAAKEAEKERVAQEKEAEKERVAQEKEAAKNQKNVPQPPSTPMDHAKVASHKNKAKKLRETLQSHKDANPDLTEEEHQLFDQLIQELDEQANNENVPTPKLEQKLKEITNLAGDKGKKPYSPVAEGEPEGGGSAGSSNAALNRRDTVGQIVSQFHRGRAIGAGLAASATAPYGAAGHLAPQLAGYGLHGATSAGHRLLQRTEDGSRAQRKLDAQKEAQAKETTKDAEKSTKAGTRDKK